MNDSEKLLILADACSDALLGGERGWERMDIKDFAAKCRLAISKQAKIASGKPIKMKMIGSDFVVVSKEWTPTSAGINGLPTPLREYIHNLQSNATADEIIAENKLLKGQLKGLKIIINSIKETYFNG